MLIDRSIISNLYITQKKSSRKIAGLFNCSESRVNYWLRKYSIEKRSISEAIYINHNPNGDPFKFNRPRSLEGAKLFGLGLGLYWGEGTKSNKNSVRLGNTDPDLILKFIEFLSVIFNVNKNKLKFGLQIFNDMSVSKAVKFWSQKLNINGSNFQKVVVTPSRSLGTYRYKSKYGVLTVYCNNSKLRDIICGMISEMKLPL